MNTSDNNATWLEECKQMLLTTKEWSLLSKQIHDILNNKLTADRVGFFADLSIQEQQVHL